MYKPLFNQRKALRFRQFSRKGYALFACLGRVVTIGVLSVATQQTAIAASDDNRVADGSAVSTSADTLSTDKEVTLDDLEVTGSRAPLALGQAARMVTVLSREDIQAAPVQSINDLLKYAVGVDVRQRGPLGAQTDIGIRGSSSEQIAILLNGVNICDPQTGHNAFDLPCDLSDIVRIEVLEGPAGRVYGTSSLVGAVNVVTNRPLSRPLPKGGEADARGDVRGERSVQARVEGGSFGYLSAACRLSLPALREGPGKGSSISASYTRSDGYQRAKSGALNSDYQGGKAFWQGTYAATDVRLQGHAGLSVKGFGSNTFYSAKYDEQYERTLKWFTALQGDVRCKTFEAGGRQYELHFKPAVYWNRSYDRFELIRGMDDKVPFNHHRTDVFGINLNSYFDWQWGRTALGAEFRNEDIVSGNLGEPLNSPHGSYKYGLNRSNLSFHLEHNVLLQRFTLSAGLVAVKNTWNGMPFKVYPGIDASYRIGNDWKVYASYNSSLRMPSFTELYYSVGGHKADKYLKPEELHAVEGGVKYLTSAVTAQASVYYHHLRNMIDWVMDPTAANPVWTSVNHTKVNTLGFESSVRLNLQQLFGWQQSSFAVAYSCNDQRKKELGQLTQSKLEYLRHKLVAQLQAHLVSRLDLGVKYRLQKRTGSYTTADGAVEPYHTYDVVDARLTWNADCYSVYAEANNLFGRRYIDYGNVPQPGTWFIVGTKITIR